MARGPGRVGGRGIQRCFNCGSYSHELRECGQPRNSEAINAATAAKRASQMVNGVRPSGRCLPTLLLLRDTPFNYMILFQTIHWLMSVVVRNPN